MTTTLQSNLTRPLALKQGSSEVSILVPADVWVAAEQLREEFLLSSTAAASTPAEEGAEDQAPEMALVARFLKFATDKSEQNDPSLQFVPVLKTVFLFFVTKYLKGNDIHPVTRHLAKDTRNAIINAFFAALVFLRSVDALQPDEYTRPASSLYAAAKDGNAKLFAMFGGQGNIEEYFDELAEIYTTYTTLVQDYVEDMAAVLREHAKSDDASVFHSKGLDVMAWLRNPDSKPDVAYLVSAPVSLPLIGLVQLMHYYAMLKILDQTPVQLRDVILGSTGHSQGIISSVVISASATFEEFFANSRKALGLLFWIGTRSQQVYPQTTLNPAILQDSLSNNEGNPTPMLVVNSLRASEVQKYVEATNLHLPEDRKIKIALINGPRSSICTGPPQSLYGLNLALRKLKAPTGLEQGRVPFSQRKVKFSSRFLPITAPFHSSYLDGVSALVAEDITRYDLAFDHTKMTVPVLSTDSGKDISGSATVTMDLVDQICSLPVHWEKATAMAGLTHVIDFGPGGSSGVGSLTARNKDGTGVQVILAGATEGVNRELSYKSDLFDANPASLRYAPNWVSEFQPKLVRSVNGEVHIDTRMSRLLAKPPLMVAGMTPSTVHEGFVSAVMNAGYHIELAGGGHYNEEAVRSKVKKIMQLTTPGASITLNTLFINVRQWGFQAPLVPKLRREGLPMEGFCCAAGVPSLEVANEFISDMHEAGIRHVSFKPGSSDAIRQVLAIAAAHPEMPIILQWTGGRAGGHHSFEDFHAPIFETYSAIRRHANVILVAGSGFGGAEDTLPYLTGDWSVEFDYPPMPFDGMLFGSRVMVAKEGMASLGVKQAIVDAPGVSDSEWEKTYKGPTGGVMTVRSELGEPIHKIATRGVRLWKEMDDTIFALPKDKRPAALLAKKDYIIKRLNADFQKVWFGKKADGSIADLQDMTYEEVINRLIELLFIKHEERWIDHSHRNLLGDILRRIEERFVGVEKNSIVQTFSQIQVPFDFAQEFINTYPLTKTQLLTTEDVGYFLFLMQRRGQKPVPFIPVLDKDFEVWFKKDSLWQAEDLSAVVDQDVQRTCILQGPAAVRYATKVDEPVKDILDGIFHSHIASLKERYYNNDDANIPQVEYFGGKPGRFESATKAISPLVKVSTDAEGRVALVETSTLESSLPQSEDWLEFLAGQDPSWFRALLTAPAVIQGKKFLNNPLARIFRPRVSQTVQFEYKDEKLHTVTVYDRRSWSASSKTNDLSPSLRARMQPNELIEVVLVEKNGERLIPFPLLFHYTPEKGYAPIHEVMEGRNERIKEFYYKLWFPAEEDQFTNCLATNAFTDKFICNGESVNTPEIKEFCQAVGNQAELYVERRQKVVYAPMDFAIVVGWKSIIKAIFPKSIDGDLLKLVHLSNGFRMLDGAESLKEGDIVDTVAEINAVVNNDSGKLVQVKGVVLRDGKRVMEVTSEFLYRGTFTDYHNTFQKTVETPMQVQLASAKDVAVLKSKEWIQWAEGEHTVAPGASLVFRLNTVVRFKNKQTFSHVETTGTVSMQISTKEHVEIATVQYLNEELSHGNPVLAYLKRNGSPIEQAVHFENGGYSVMPEGSSSSEVISPFSNEPYAKVSGDFNPIHVNPYFADLAELPGTITHGMWTSASTRKFVEIFAADNHPQRVTSYEVSFLSMVLPQDRLSTKLSHIGMINGKKIIKVETVNQNGTKVVEGTAEIDQPTIAYVFTGQGSQEQGMGMALYDSSPVAKEIWQKADRHFLENYGFSILDIVRNNPLKKTIHFGGPKGNAIRQNYMSMRYDLVEQDGSIKSLPLFPGINETTHFYTFQSPNGLLAATQFTQPALTLMEKAAFEDMRAKGLIQGNCAFAGHSLGEYSALASIGDVLPIESLVDVVFYRGMTMQVAVPRDEVGRSNYGMVAINPSRVSPTFNDSALRYVVDAIARQSNGLLEIVNENVENWQYVAAGELSNLDALSTVLNYLKVQKIDLQKLMETMPLEEVKKHLSQIIAGALEKVAEKLAKDGLVKPERGVATIPLAGIDVPFHSSFLLSGVAPFRTYLAKKINPTNINVPLLTAKYIPNLTAKPFSIEKSYIEGVYSLTSSPRLAKVLKNWVDTKLTAKQQQRLGYTLLVELLAYQFASPVRWIETQDRLFKEFNIVRLIEVGPSPTLCGMAQRTLKFKYEAYDDALTFQRSTLCTSKDAKEIYYAMDNVESSSPTPAAAAAPAPKAAAPVAAYARRAGVTLGAGAPAGAAPVQMMAAAPAGGAPAAVADAPIKAIDILHVIVAQKIKKTVEEVPLSKAIKDLVGGKSTLQNEILGDLQKEFGGSGFPEKGEEAPLEDLGNALQGNFNGSLGKQTTSLIAKMIGSKMPGGFTQSSAKGYLASAYGLGPLRADGALLLGLTMEPAARLGAEPEAKAWLDTVAQAYARRAGISLGGGGGGAVAGGAVGGAMMNSEEFNQFQAKQNAMMYQHLEIYARYLEKDLRAGEKQYEEEKLATLRLQADIDQWMAEHGDYYAEGIKPNFSVKKARKYDSHWNWVRQDALSLLYDMIFGRLTVVDREIVAQCIHVMNRANPQLLQFMIYHIDNTAADRGKTYALAKEFGNMLIQNCREVLEAAPVYKDVGVPTGPSTSIDNKGNILYEEVQRAGVRKLDHYVKDMAAGGKMSEFSNRQKKEAKKETIPFLHLKKKNPHSESGWEFSQRLTAVYLDVLTNMAKDGVTYENRMVLMTGAGKDSIGSAILKGLLSGGAKVIVTTSRFSRDVTEYYQSIYQRHGSKNSSLVVVPFNGGSKQDVDALVNYIYDKDPKKGLGWDLDYIIPFAAISVQGKEIDNIDSQSELAHRIMLTNVLRLLGNVKTKKMENGYDTRPAQVILPLSPNHGTFGADGLYGESKVALETLFNRWTSESWSAYLTITGAVIGWTRGTGLMSGNNIVAEGLEKYGVRTFSAQEMAFNILGLMHPSITNLCQIEPVWADLNGGLQYLVNVNEVSANLRAEYRQTSEIRKAIVAENTLDFKEVHGAEAERKHQPHKVTPRANMKFPFPELKNYKDLSHAHKLRGMLDLENVVVVTGFSEVGPWGNSRTRWEMEAKGQFSLEGCIEMAWIMGFIKHHNGNLKTGAPYSGWVDAKTGEPVKDKDVKSKYEKQILEHTGIRLIEPELFGGYDPKRKGLLQEVLIDHDLEAFEVSKEEAQMFKLEHGDKVDIYEEESGQWAVKFKKGANMYIPKALKFDRLVAGQIPTGWDAARYGVPKDIIDQVDTITLYVLISTVEALVASGITDPYEFYQYVHVSEVGNTAGSGVGGMLSLRGMYRDRVLDKPVQKDILQESFINTMPAWINMLLLSSSGPIKTPVGACATAVESVEIGVDTIQSGKAKIVIVGGYDDFQEEGSYEFANMKATSNSEEEFAHGRTPQEMSRPATSTRSGFMESHGAGIEILMQAKLAIEMGVPIYGIVALTNTATDKEGRSVPAPGQGVLTTAREVKSKMPSRLLDIKYRKRQVDQRRAQIKQWVENEYTELGHELEELKAAGELTVSEEEYLASETERIQKEAKRQHREALNLWGNEFYRQDPQIAPLRGALASFGLTIDDIGVGSFHGTSTKANDKNESEVVNKQMEHLGRSKGNALPSIWQKYLTGHPKGAAAAWMMNGVLQVLQTGLIPGNRNADNIDDTMRQYEHVLYTSRSIQTDGVKAGLLKSFGFGQVGGEVLLIHSDYILGALEEHEYEAYKVKQQARQAKSYRYLHDSMTGGPALVQVKNAPPYTPELESPVYLNPSARAQYNNATKSWAFNAKALVPASAKVDVGMTRAILETSAESLGDASSRGVGVDVEMVSAINIENETFLERNFTAQEIEYCLSRPDPQASFAGRWSAKEAVVKAVSSFSLETEKVWTQGAGAGLKEIEIVMAESGAPSVVFAGAAQEAAARAGVKEMKVSISHSGAYAVAVANAL
ncbi:MAG: hypothetical protein BYD32DRAFT_366717 [Podila humilis]|nr:MAG: hypothetical protein BYD32DRAFT_366717 [Podila humilis]